MQLKIDEKFKHRMRTRLSGRTAEVGILQNKRHYAPKRFGSDSIGGKATRAMDRSRPNGSLFSVSRAMKSRSGIDIFKKPFEKNTKDFRAFMDEFMKIILKKGGRVPRASELLAACVTNPIAQRKYGSNTSATRKAKGFNCRFVDTGQIFRNIKGRIRKKS